MFEYSDLFITSVFAISYQLLFDDKNSNYYKI